MRQNERDKYLDLDLSWAKMLEPEQNRWRVRRTHRHRRSMGEGVTDERMSASDAGVTRRRFVAKAGGAGLALTGVSGLLAACGGSSASTAGTAARGPYKGTLRVLGIGVDLTDQIKAMYEQSHPGITLEFTVKTQPETAQLAITQSGDFDIWSGYFHQLSQVWPARTLMPVDTRKLTRWAQVSRLEKLGALRPGGKVGQGQAAFRRLFLESDLVTFHEGDNTASQPLITLAPSNINSDSLGFNHKVTGTLTSWGELLNPKWQGRVALINDPDIGLIDAAMAAEATGQMRFADKGALTKAEVDGLFKILMALKGKGHFRSFWSSFEDSVNLMQSGEVVVQSMWSPAVTLLQGQSFPVSYMVPREGYRGWGSGNGIFKHVGGDAAKLQAAYDYLNWWNSPQPAGNMAAQGYYNAVIASSRAGLSAADRAYWLDGKPAPKDLLGPDGRTVVVHKGQRRDGGSYEQRQSGFNTWNSHQPQADYISQLWQEFTS